VPAGGLFGAIKNTYLIYECTGICACIQEQNADRYIQICTDGVSAYAHVLRIRNAYLHVFRIQIQADTCRYALDTGVHMHVIRTKIQADTCRYELPLRVHICIYLLVCGLNVFNIQTHMHRIQSIENWDTCRYMSI
jgi:hypothetical protein